MGCHLNLLNHLLMYAILNSQFKIVEGPNLLSSLQRFHDVPTREPILSRDSPKCLMGTLT